MITGTSIEQYHLRMKEPNIENINWLSLLRKHQLGTISMLEKHLLKLYIMKHNIAINID